MGGDVQIVREGFVDRRSGQDRIGYQAELSFADRKAECEDVCVIVICREGFMREAIETSLQSAGLYNVESVATIADLGTRPSNDYTFLCIVSSEADVCSTEDLAQLDTLIDRNWIIMSHSCHCALFRKLHECGANVSAVPFDISGKDLAHLARLAANRHRVLVDSFCEQNISFAPARLDCANLSADHIRLLRQIARGDSNKAIAMQERWSDTKVKMQVRALLKKLGVANRTQAAVLAIQSGL